MHSELQFQWWDIKEESSFAGLVLSPILASHFCALFQLFVIFAELTTSVQMGQRCLYTLTRETYKENQI